MDQSIDRKIQRPKETAALMSRFEDAVLDALSEAAASARQAGDAEKAERMENFIRQHRVGLLGRRALAATEDPSN